MKPLAAVLILAAILFVVLAVVPQLREVQRAKDNEAAGASALIGFWRIDADATLDSWRTSPRFSKAFARLPAERIEAMTSRVRSRVGNDPYMQISADRIISSYNGEAKGISYTISNVSGNVFTTDCITDVGGLSVKMILTVADDRIEMFNDAIPAGMDLAIILNRVH